MKALKTILIESFKSSKGKRNESIPLTYQIFGRELSYAPIVLVNHALTGNSNVTGKNGWWNNIIGSNKVIDTEKYTILVFNIPGNGFDGLLFEDYKRFKAKDIAQLFLLAIEQLKIKSLFAIIGGSLGGGIAWEMCALKPNITKHLIPVASDWKATDWLIANCQIQEHILNNSNNPVKDARMHAMLLYRTPESINQRFKRSINEDLGIFNIESWLLHHGKKLQQRFQLSAYKLMNHLLKTIAVDDIDQLKRIEAEIHLISVNSDIFFTAKENEETYQVLKEVKECIYHHVIDSIHGHDAFLIEYPQLDAILKPIFQKVGKIESYKSYQIAHK